MGASTPIRWCDSTVNPTMGCDGCEFRNPAAGKKVSYAEALHDRYGGESKGYSPTFEEVTLWPGRTATAARWRDLSGTARPGKPWLDGLPRHIFVSDMSDAFSDLVTFAYLEAEVVAAARSPQGRRHRWLWLTKRPQRMAHFADVLLAKAVAWPVKLWAGTSVTTQATAARVPHLLRVGGPGAVRFVSAEPQHEPVDLSAWLPGLDWVIRGGESGRASAPFQVGWATDLLGQCWAAGTKY